MVGWGGGAREREVRVTLGVKQRDKHRTERVTRRSGCTDPVRARGGGEVGPAVRTGVSVRHVTQGGGGGKGTVGVMNTVASPFEPRKHRMKSGTPV